MWSELEIIIHNRVDFDRTKSDQIDSQYGIRHTQDQNGNNDAKQVWSVPVEIDDPILITAASGIGALACDQLFDELKALAAAPVFTGAAVEVEAVFRIYSHYNSRLFGF